MSRQTIVEYFGLQQDSKCGYCKSPEHSKLSHGMWAHVMTGADYQALLDRGWRRSGKYCYKPIMDRTCCPQYTIRCRALEFRLSRSQRKVLKRVNNYLKAGVVPKKYGSGDASSSSMREEDPQLEPSRGMDLTPGQGVLVLTLDGAVGMETATAADDSSKHSSNLSQAGHSQSGNQIKTSTVKVSSTRQGFKKTPFSKESVPMEPSYKTGIEPQSQLLRGKDHRRMKKHERLRKKGIDPANNPRGRTKTLDEYLSEPKKWPESSHTLELSLVLVGSDMFRKRASEAYDLFKRYQMRIHGDTEDDCSMRMYLSFLVESPLQAEGESSAFPGYGSFHQHYLLDGKLIAVGVIDILSHSVSSKYFFYDPEYDFLKLGTYSALREISLVQELSKLESKLVYYYMGYYIHDCVKMRYKGAYYPSDLLCPESFTWVPIETCRPKLDCAKYARFSDEGIRDIGGTTVNMANVGILFKRTAIRYKKYKKQKKINDNVEVEEYARLTGLLFAYNALLFRND